MNNKFLIRWILIVSVVFGLVLAAFLASFFDDSLIMLFGQDYSYHSLAWLMIIPAIIVIVILAILIFALSCLVALGAIIVGLVIALVAFGHFILWIFFPFFVLWVLWKIFLHIRIKKSSPV